ncbi:MAG: hypothetical protein HYX41_00090 [Bdellovibrio sp.]|nr:hypothetical protein [Bdellovibrio sp.]
MTGKAQNSQEPKNPSQTGRSVWIKHGLLNTVEQAITRVADGLTTLFLIWFLSPEVFSKLAMAQAVVAPLLLFFLAPETVLYRDFSVWKDAGVTVLAARLRAFRVFGYLKGAFALLVSLGVGFFLSGQSYFEWVFSLIWAFSLALAPQVSGADREFLRLSLKLETLSLLSLYQKTVLFIGTAATLKIQGDAPVVVQLAGLAGVGLFSALSSAFLARNQAIAFLGSQQVSEDRHTKPYHLSMRETLFETLKDFSIWQHLQGVALNWVQTMDLFTLGLFHFPARQVGLYASVLKLVNFSNFAPLALTNAFGLWLGRKTPAKNQELPRVKKLTLILALTNGVQGLVFWLLSGKLVQLLSHGRWSDVEQLEMLRWFNWILLGNMILTSTFLVTHWILVRSSARQTFLRSYLPWTALSFLFYGSAAYLSAGTHDPLWVAKMNGAVSTVFCILLIFIYRRVRALASVGDR